jgi:Zn-dependent protease
VFAIPLRILNLPPETLVEAVFLGQTTDPLTSLALLFGQIVFWNVLLFMFNILPFFPIDGWHIVLALLPPDLAHTWQRHARTSQYVLFGLILLSFARIPGLNILGMLISQPAFSITFFLLGLR